MSIEKEIQALLEAGYTPEQIVAASRGQEEPSIAPTDTAPAPQRSPGMMNPKSQYGLAELQAIDPTLISALAQAGLINDRQALLAVQMKQAEKLKEGAKVPQGTHAGRMYIAASPGEHLGAMGESLGGTMQQIGTANKYNKLLEQYGGTAERMMNVATEVERRRAAAEAAAEQLRSRQKYTGMGSLEYQPSAIPGLGE